jgi:hypothetical protein
MNKFSACVSEKGGIKIMEDMNIGALFVGAGCVPNRFFIHNCPEKDEISNLIQVSKHSLEF